MDKCILEKQKFQKKQTAIDTLFGTSPYYATCYGQNWHPVTHWLFRNMLHYSCMIIKFIKCCILTISFFYKPHLKPWYNAYPFHVYEDRQIVGVLFITHTMYSPFPVLLILRWNAEIIEILWWIAKLMDKYLDLIHLATWFNGIFSHCCSLWDSKNLMLRVYWNWSSSVTRLTCGGY